MGIGAAIISAKEKLYANYTAMANDIGISSNTLNRLKDINNKEDLKSENIEVLEKISIFLGMSINELINFELENKDDNNGIDIKYISDCDDVGIIVDELIGKVNEKNIKIDGFIMNEESKQAFIDSLQITRKLTKNKL